MCMCVVCACVPVCLVCVPVCLVRVPVCLVCVPVCACVYVCGFNLDRQNCPCAWAAAFQFFTFIMMEVWYNLELNWMQ